MPKKLGGLVRTWSGIVTRPRFRRFIARAAGDQRGVATLEAVLILTVLIGAIMGGVHFGTSALHKMQMSNAVRAGMQYATVRKPVQGDVSGIENAVANAAPDDTTGTREITVTLYCQCPDGTAIVCENSCAGGAERESYVSIVLQEDYEPPFNLPVTPGRMNFRTDETLRLN